MVRLFQSASLTDLLAFGAGCGCVGLLLSAVLILLLLLLLLLLVCLLELLQVEGSLLPLTHHPRPHATA